MTRQACILTDDFKTIPSQTLDELSLSTTKIDRSDLLERITVDLAAIGNALDMPGLTHNTFMADLAITVFRSFYQGYPCFILTRLNKACVVVYQSDLDRITQSLAQPDDRDKTLNELSNTWRAKQHEADIKDVPLTKALTRFTEQNRDALMAHRIPLCVIVEPNNDNLRAFCESWDARNLISGGPHG